MQQVSLKRIPSYLKARSPQGLRRLMLLNNAKASTFFEYTQIQYISDEKYWYAWYYRDVDTNDITDLETPPTTEVTDG
jgi:hypothetical protein